MSRQFPLFPTQKIENCLGIGEIWPVEGVKGAEGTLSGNFIGRCRCVEGSSSLAVFVASFPPVLSSVLHYLNVTISVPNSSHLDTFQSTRRLKSLH